VAASEAAAPAAGLPAAIDEPVATAGVEVVAAGAE
jgi:hypothetical protein